MSNVVSYGNVILVKKTYNNEGRRIMQLHDVNKQKDLIGGYVDNDQLLSVHVTDTLLRYIEHGYRVKVEDEWK